MKSISKPMFREFMSMYLALIALFFSYTNVAEPLFFDIYHEELYEDLTHDYAAVFLLLEKLYPLSSNEQWQDVFLDIQRESNIPVEVISFKDLNLKEEYVVQIESGSIVIPDYPKDIHYRLIAPGVVARVGPMGEIDSANFAYLLYKFIPIFLFGGFTLVWVVALQLRLMKLERTMHYFSNGKFNVQAPSGLWAVGDLNQVFNHMANRLKQYINSQKQLTNAVSHELRSPLSRMRFQLEMALESHTDKKRNQYLQGMNEDIDGMDQMIHEMLMYSKLESTVPLLDIKYVDLYHWLTQQQADLKKETSMQIEISTMGECQFVQMDPKLMNSLLRNLVSNAVKHTNRKIVLGATVRENVCYLWVDDDGAGIPADKAHDLFEPFTRLDSSRNKSTGGYGLGLAIVSQIARQHGGSVEISTSPYGGARLLVQWPFSS